MRPVDEQTVLVTGATDGLGRALARELAARGATVLVHGRSQERLDDTMRELREATGSARLRPYRADLASLEQVRRLGREVGAEQRLDVLVNNAGIAGVGGRQESADGHELRFAVNYLAPSCSPACCCRCWSGRRRRGSSTSPRSGRCRSTSTT